MSDAYPSRSRARVEFSRVTLNKVQVVVGRGTEDDPLRHVTHYYEDDGTLLWEYDPCDHAPSPPDAIA